MSNPWNLRRDDSRQPDSIPTFIIFCEDTNCEPIYFKYFETTKIKVNPVKSQKSKLDNVINALCHCRNQGMMNSQDGTVVFSQEDTQIWCVFDRDKESEANLPKGNAAFDLAIKTAMSSGFKVAWSNDSFELWVLLHFEDVDINNNEYKNRLTYYTRLTEIFRTLPNPNEDLTKALVHSSFSYKRDLKHENNFRNIVRSEIVSRTQTAIRRAKILDQHFNGSNHNYHEKSPCTLIYDLVEELIRLGEKST